MLAKVIVVDETLNFLLVLKAKTGIITGLNSTAALAQHCLSLANVNKRQT